MNPSNAVKIVAAFLAGIVIALGSALIYVRAADHSPSHAVAQTSAPAAPDVAQNGPQTLPNADQTPGATASGGAKDTSGATTSTKRSTLAALGHKFRHNDDPVEADPADSGSQAAQEVPAAAPTPKSPPPTPVVKRARVNPPPVRKPVQIAQVKAQELPKPDPVPAAPVAPPSLPVAPQPAPVTPAPVRTTPVAPATPAVRQPRTVTIAAGTNLVVRLGETLSTEHNYAGDAFRATLDTPIILDGAIIADRGSRVLGQVVNAQRAGRVQGVSNLSLKLMEINTTDGQRVSVQTDAFDKKGATGTKSDAAKVGGGAALGAIIGAIAGGGRGAGVGAGVGGAAGAGDVLLTRGQPTVLSNETRLIFRLASPVTITERLNY